jgi:hypothetical protein
VADQLPYTGLAFPQLLTKPTGAPLRLLHDPGNKDPNAELDAFLDSLPPGLSDAEVDRLWEQHVGAGQRGEGHDSFIEEVIKAGQELNKIQETVGPLYSETRIEADKGRDPRPMFKAQEEDRIKAARNEELRLKGIKALGGDPTASEFTTGRSGVPYQTPAVSPFREELWDEPWQWLSNNPQLPEHPLKDALASPENAALAAQFGVTTGGYDFIRNYFSNPIDIATLPATAASIGGRALTAGLKYAPEALRAMGWLDKGAALAMGGSAAADVYDNLTREEDLPWEQDALSWLAPIMKGAGAYGFHKEGGGLFDDAAKITRDRDWKAMAAAAPSWGSGRDKAPLAFGQSDALIDPTKGIQVEQFPLFDRTGGQHVGPSQFDPAQLDRLRRATLEETRQYNFQPGQYPFDQAEALADNLITRLESPEAIEKAAEIYLTLPDAAFGKNPNVARMTALATTGQLPADLAARFDAKLGQIAQAYGLPWPTPSNLGQDLGDAMAARIRAEQPNLYAYLFQQADRQGVMGGPLRGVPEGAPVPNARPSWQEAIIQAARERRAGGEPTHTGSIQGPGSIVPPGGVPVELLGIAAGYGAEPFDDPNTDTDDWIRDFLKLGSLAALGVRGAKRFRHALPGPKSVGEFFETLKGKPQPVMGEAETADWLRQQMADYDTRMAGVASDFETQSAAELRKVVEGLPPDHPLAAQIRLKRPDLFTPQGWGTLLDEPDLNGLKALDDHDRALALQAAYRRDMGLPPDAPLSMQQQFEAAGIPVDRVPAAFVEDANAAHRAEALAEGPVRPQEARQAPGVDLPPRKLVDSPAGPEFAPDQDLNGLAMAPGAADLLAQGASPDEDDDTAWRKWLAAGALAAGGVHAYRKAKGPKGVKFNPGPEFERLWEGRKTAMTGARRFPLEFRDRVLAAVHDVRQPALVPVNKAKKAGVVMDALTDPETQFDLSSGGRIGGRIQVMAEDFENIFQEAQAEGVEKPWRAYLDMVGQRHARLALGNKGRRLINSTDPEFQQAGKDILARLAADKATFSTDAEIQAGLQSIRQQLTPDRFQKVEALAKKVFALNRKALDEAYAGGLVEPATYQELISRPDDYIPMERIIDAVEDAGQGKQVFSLKTQRVLFKAEGSERVHKDPLVGSMRRFAEVIRETERNKGARTYITTLTSPEVQQKAPEVAALFRKVAPGQKIPRGWDTISYFDQGVPQTYAVPKLIADSLKLADEDTAKLIGETVLRYGQGSLQKSATIANFAFSLPNVLNDARGARKLSEAYTPYSPKDAASFAHEWAQAVQQITSRSPEYREALESGAMYSTRQKNIDPAKFLGLDKEHAHPLQKLAHGAVEASWIGPLIDKTEDVNNVLEEATKLTTYNRLRKKGYTKDAAAIETRRYGGSPDFAKQGWLTRKVGLLSMFFGPQVRGAIRTVTGFARKPQRMIPVAMAATASAYGLHRWNSQFINPDSGRPELDHITRDDKHRYYVMILPEWAGGGIEQKSNGMRRWRTVKIPKDHVSQVFVNPIQDAIEGTFGAQTMVNEVTSVLPGDVEVRADKHGPLDVVDRVAATLNPVVGAPIALFRNKNPFFQTPIMPRRIEGLDPIEQTTDRTSPSLKAMADVYNASPLHDLTGLDIQAPELQYLVEGMFPGPGEAIVRGADWVSGNKKEIDPPRGELEAISRIPVLGQIARRFIASPTDQVQQDQLDAFYELLGESDRATRTIGHMTNTHPQDLAGFMQRPGVPEQWALHGELTQTAKDLGELQRQRELILRTVKDPAAQRQMLHGLYLANRGILQQADAIGQALTK